jgi:ubiquinone/menaquinone biosynthesis C-methylase UbiE
MTDRHRQQWEALGTEDPYWAVLSDPEKKGGKWDKSDFFQTGVEEICDLLAKISQLGIKPRLGLALDYGCGVGRLSRALASSFQKVLGVDISEAMLSEARSINAKYSNLEFLRNNGESLTDVADETVDLIYSNLVLQHSPRKIQRLLIREFCRVLRPKGVLVFQTPSHQDLKTVGGLVHFLTGNLVSKLATRIRYGKRHVMEMHHLRQHEVLALLKENGLKIIATETCDAAGTAFISYTYFAVKKPLL